MTRFEKIHNMTPEEMADVIFEKGIDNHIDFCGNNQECSDYDKEYGEIPEGMCRQCMINWLKEEIEHEIN